MSVNGTAGPALAPELPPPRPPARHERVRNISIGAGVVLVAVTAGWVASGVSHPAAAPPRPSATATVPVSPPASVPEPSSVAGWLAGPGYPRMVAVQHDLERVSSDAAAQDLAAFEADGSVLGRDARAAAEFPPPVGTADYVAAMRLYEAAGDDMAAGRVAASVVHMDAANQLILQVDAAVRAAAPPAAL